MNVQRKLKIKHTAKLKPNLKLVHNKAPQIIPLSCRYCELREERKWQLGEWL